MGLRRLALLTSCLAVALLSFTLLDFWSSRNAPLFKRFERQWRDDVETLEQSGKLPKEWTDIKEIELIGGTPDTKKFLSLVKVPLKTNPNGHHRLEVLVVLWEEDGVRGVLVQYNLAESGTKKYSWELGRTFILSKPGDDSPLQALLAEILP